MTLVGRHQKMTEKHWISFLLLALLVSTSVLSVTALETTFLSEENVDIPEHQVRFWGPYLVEAGTKLRVDWSANRKITVAILSEEDYLEDHSYDLVYAQVKGDGQYGTIQFEFEQNGMFYIAVQSLINIGATVNTLTGRVLPGSTPSFLQDVPIEVLYGAVFVLAIVIVVLVFLLMKKRRNN